MVEGAHKIREREKMADVAVVTADRPTKAAGVAEAVVATGSGGPKKGFGCAREGPRVGMNRIQQSALIQRSQPQHGAAPAGKKGGERVAKMGPAALKLGFLCSRDPLGIYGND